LPFWHYSLLVVWLHTWNLNSCWKCHGDHSKQSNFRNGPLRLEARLVIWSTDRVKLMRLGYVDVAWGLFEQLESAWVLGCQNSVNDF
jgi:hypothetical protein